MLSIGNIIFDATAATYSSKVMLFHHRVCAQWTHLHMRMSYRTFAMSFGLSSIRLLLLQSHIFCNGDILFIFLKVHTPEVYDDVVSRPGSSLVPAVQG